MTKKNLLALAGVIATVLGVVFAIPSSLNGQVFAAIISAIFIIVGLILLAFAFGD